VILQSIDIPATPATPELLDQVCDKLRAKHCSIRTGQAYVDWIKRFILHFDKRHQADPRPGLHAELIA